MQGIRIFPSESEMVTMQSISNMKIGRIGKSEEDRCRQDYLDRCIGADKAGPESRGDQI